MQAQIRENAQALQQYVNDLHAWQTQIKEKDNQLIQSSKNERKIDVPIRDYSNLIFDSSSSVSPSSDSSTKPKREMPSLERVEEIASKIEKQKENNVNSSSNQNKIIPNQSSKEKEGDKERKEKSLIEKEKGNQFLKEGKYPNAIVAYTSSINLDPTNALSYANRALVYLKLKEWEKAEEDCNDAIIIDNKYAKAFARRGTARLSMKRYYEAIDDFQEVLTLEPGNKEAIGELAKIDKIVSSLPQPTNKVAPPPNTNQPTISPRKKIVIEEVGEAVPKEEKEKVIIKEVAPTPNQKQTETVAQEKTKKEVSKPSSAPRVFSFQVPVPKESPNTSYEFESVWNSIKSEEASFYSYMKMIPPSSYPKIFKNAMNYDIFISIIKLLDRQFLKQDDLPLVGEVLVHLSAINRFEMNVRFLTKEDKQVVNQLLERIKDLPGVQVSSLKAKYEIQ
eukprot:TRINITY_DN5182_c0_g1_i1.p1 TRINITY_DN5182_c0_g1~~TRINITY_DN5182_c0_g1_i1.p1  ORF type:complete len:449 (-),score=151.58 TRINITY_DN5182_c0_g1_i1:30-1376(-)